jgi:hypothetical protein
MQGRQGKVVKVRGTRFVRLPDVDVEGLRFLAQDWLASNHVGARNDVRRRVPQSAWPAAHATSSSAGRVFTIRSGSIPARAALSQP